ncbi:probable peptidyl-tRNA hydrolase 2 isoform X2 [Bemisia tabaci]|uniref:probable peptidyl-tRNA hydrolase 2 isoform X2 n=1 Tax=Bemisia tabaci TaxID=7038 RepID=UPI003B28D264
MREIHPSENFWFRYINFLADIVARAGISSVFADLVARNQMDETKTLDSVLVARLLEMGFSNEEASVALSRSDNSMDGALAFLLQDEPLAPLNEGLESASEEVSEIAEPNLGEEGDWEDVDEEAREDPIKMMIAVNTEFKMSVGKTASQVAHAAVGLYSTISSKKAYSRFIREWNEEGGKKIVLNGRNTATLKLLVEQAKKMKLKNYAVRDAGLTEIPPGSWTAVAVIGRDSAVSKIFGQLPLLK